MEELIEAYLFQQRNCPLPSIGCLCITDGTAIMIHRDDKIRAPLPHIELSAEEISPENFISYISEQKKITHSDAGRLLDEYCTGLKKLNSYAEIKLEQAGKFYIDASGVLVFKQENFPKEFLPSIIVKRVSHPNTSHNLQVGDTVTTSGAMTEYYNNTPVKNEKWWIRPMIIAAIIAVILVMYFNDERHNESFGNVQRLIPSPVHETYLKK